MGMLSDLYIANSDEIEKMDLSQAFRMEHTHLDIKGLDYVTLCTLYGILANVPFEEALNSIVMLSGGDEGPCFF